MGQRHGLLHNKLPHLPVVCPAVSFDISVPFNFVSVWLYDYLFPFIIFLELYMVCATIFFLMFLVFFYLMTGPNIRSSNVVKLFFLISDGIIIIFNTISPSSTNGFYTKFLNMYETLLKCFMKNQEYAPPWIISALSSTCQRMRWCTC